MLSIIDIKVIGQPSSTGLLITEVEKPFFNAFQSNTELPIKLDFKSLEEVGIKDTYQLPMMRDELFDLVSIRLIQNSHHETTLNGLDVIGLNLSSEKIRLLINTYGPVVDKHLQEKYRAKILGLWSFGPQELFCSKPIHQFSDIKGMKIRVQNEPMAKFFESLGAIPAIMSFDDTYSALQNNLIDCALSSATSATSAGWLDYVQSYVPIAFSSGVNFYAITLSKWNLLDQKQQEIIQKAFDKHIDNMWKYSKYLYVEQQNCIVGKDSCSAKKYEIAKIEPSKEDLALIKLQMKIVSLKNWFEGCNKEYPECKNEWLNLVGQIAGIE
jgi:hypothetical protein